MAVAYHRLMTDLFWSVSECGLNTSIFFQKSLLLIDTAETFSYNVQT